MKKKLMGYETKIINLGMVFFFFCVCVFVCMTMKKKINLNKEDDEPCFLFIVVSGMLLFRLCSLCVSGVLMSNVIWAKKSEFICVCERERDSKRINEWMKLMNENERYIMSHVFFCLCVYRLFGVIINWIFFRFFFSNNSPNYNKLVGWEKESEREIKKD